MIKQILKKEIYTLSIEYLQSLKEVLPEAEFDQLQKMMESQKFLNLIDKIVSIYAKYLNESQIQHMLSSFQQSKPIFRTLIRNMPAIVVEMDSFLKEEKFFIEEEC